MSLSMKPQFVRHPEDDGIDEILFCDQLPIAVEDSRRTAFLRLSVRERYKTSGLSGDEWRFSAMLDLRERPDGEWVATSSGYHRLRDHAAFLYAELFGDFRAGQKHDWLYRRKVGAIAFLWKGLPVWSASYNGEATDLLVACGHLPGVLISAPEEGQQYHDALSRLCCQPGCAAPLVSVYRLRKDWCSSCGEHKEMYWEQRRGFCRAHLRRGDCGLNDADNNYEVLSGPGPDGNEPAADVVRPSYLVAQSWLPRAPEEQA